MSTPVGPDEKVCPYCAETIKAAAIKCRFCQSDLPEPEPAAEPDAPVPAADQAVDETADQAAEEAAAPTWPGPFTEAAAAPLSDAEAPVEPKDPVVVGLAALCGVLAVLFGVIVLVLALTQRPGDLAIAASGQVTDTAYRSAAMSAAAADATTVLSYSYKTLAEDEQAARAVLTPKFAPQYQAVMADAGPKATSAKLTQKATVLTSALLSITRTRAEVLLSVNTVTTAEGSPSQQLTQNRVKMTLERKDGDWAVSDMVRF